MMSSKIWLSTKSILMMGTRKMMDFLWWLPLKRIFVWLSLLVVAISAFPIHTQSKASLLVSKHVFGQPCTQTTPPPTRGRCTSSSLAGSRREWFEQTGAFLLSHLLHPQAAQARGLVQFPCTEGLGNTYHFMRVGEDLLSAKDIWSTNPLFLTNREESVLSLRGIQQVEETIQKFKEEWTSGTSLAPSVIVHSLAASAIDTANMIGKEIKVGRDRIMPEYTYLDPRAVGIFDGMPLRTTEEAVWALDVDQAGPNGQGGRPPANEDSTPHETLGDQAIRLFQLMSVLETLYSGDTILLVFPDGTGPALLSALIAGIPLNRVHELDYEPGEARLNITMATTLALLEERQQSQDFRERYQARIDAGRVELQRLMSLVEGGSSNGGGDDDGTETAPTPFVSAKEEQMEQERLLLEEEHQERLRREQEQLEQERRARQEVAQKLAAEREERKALERQKVLERQQARAEARQEQRNQAEEKRRQDRMAVQALRDQQPQASNEVSSSVLYGGVAAAVGAVALASVFGANDEANNAKLARRSELEMVPSPDEPKKKSLDPTEAPIEDLVEDPIDEPTKDVMEESFVEDSSLDGQSRPRPLVGVPTVNATNITETMLEGDPVTKTVAMVNETAPLSDGSTKQQVKQRVNGDSKAKFESPEVEKPPVDKYEAARIAMEEYMNSDDGGEAWLDSLSQMINDEE